jgi:hypothetical protein
VLRLAAVSRRRFVVPLAAIALCLVGWAVFTWASYPTDKTPLGAYLRVVSAVNRDRPEDFFAYIETAAQHACYTIRDYRRATRGRVLASYPEPETYTPRWHKQRMARTCLRSTRGATAGSNACVAT